MGERVYELSCINAVLALDLELAMKASKYPIDTAAVAEKKAGKMSTDS